MTGQLTPEEFVERWFRCHRPQPCQQEGISTEAHRRLHEQGKAAMLADLRRVHVPVEVVIERLE